MLIALALGLIGGMIFVVLGMPLPWLLGAALANFIGGSRGLGPAMPRAAQAVSLSLIGTMVGSTLTPDLPSRIPGWTLSLIGMAIFLAVVIPIAIAYNRRIIRLDPITATFSAIPGGLSEMIVMGAQMGADERSVALTQIVRVITILSVVPLIIQFGLGNDLSGMLPNIKDGGPLELVDALILFACFALGPWFGRTVRLPSPLVLGALALSAIVHLAGITEARPPAALVALVQLLVGCNVGSKFGKVDLVQTARVAGQSFLLSLGLLMLTFVFAFTLASVTDLPFNALLLAFVPGGIAEISVIALVLGVDPVFVAAHHTFRLLLIYPLPSFFKRWWARKGS